MRRQPVATILPLMFAFLAAASSASALPIAIDFVDVPGPLDGGFRDLAFAASGSGTGELTFDLIGYRTVDGANALGDQFTVSLNGTLLFAGRFDMGGGGPNVVDFAIPGALVVSSTSNGFGLGGLTRLSVPIDIQTGANTIRFDYGVMQGLSDEGWGYRNAQLRGEIAAPVPEPGSLALVGMALLSAAWRRRQPGRAAATLLRAHEPS